MVGDPTAWERNRTLPTEASLRPQLVRDLALQHFQQLISNFSSISPLFPHQDVLPMDVSSLLLASSPSLLLCPLLGRSAHDGNGYLRPPCASGDVSFSSSSRSASRVLVAPAPLSPPPSVPYRCINVGQESSGHRTDCSYRRLSFPPLRPLPYRLS